MSRNIEYSRYGELVRGQPIWVVLNNDPLMFYWLDSDYGVVRLSVKQCGVPVYHSPVSLVYLTRLDVLLDQRDWNESRLADVLQEQSRLAEEIRREELSPASVEDEARVLLRQMVELTGQLWCEVREDVDGLDEARTKAAALRGITP